MKFARWWRAPQASKKRAQATFEKRLTTSAGLNYRYDLALESLESRFNLTPVLAGLEADYLVAGSAINATSIVYTATFSEPVTGVDLTDFSLALTGTIGATLTQVQQIDFSVYTVTVSGITGSGTLGLNLVANGSISDALSNPLVSNFSGQSYVIDHQAPYVLSIDRTTPSGPNTNASSVTYTVIFNEAVTGVDPTDFALALTGSIGTTLLQVQPVGVFVYTVTVSGITGSGTLGLNLIDNGTIDDLIDNPLHQASAPSTFEPTQDFATGLAPYSLAVADVNGDGHPDLITANLYANTVSVLMGNGDGSFQPTQDFATGAGSYSVAVADVNGDGHPDLITANLYAESASVLLGNGDGSFQPTQDFATGSVPSSVMLADVNGDGHPDLITANLYADTLSVLLGNGDGSFQPTQDFATGAAPNFVAVADVNGDGDLDLITANLDADTASVLLGNGDGSFQPAQDFVTGSTPGSVAVADVNGDGHLDLVTANRSDDTASVLLGNGDGTFQSKQDSTTGSAPFSVAAADVNGDGHPDLITANLYDDTVSVLHGNGNGTFQSKQDSATGSAPFSLVVLDVNGDGHSDLITANLYADTASVLLNKAADDFTGQVYTIDQTRPVAQSIYRTNPAGPNADAGSVTYTVTFSEPVTGVDSSDFVLALAGSVTAGSSIISGSGSVYTVTINDVTGDGTLGLNLFNDGTIRDLDTNLLIGGLTGEVYVMSSPPVVQSINRTNPVGPIAGPGSVTYTVTFSEPVTGVDPSDFVLALTGSVTGDLPVISGSGSVYTVTINAITGVGTLALYLFNDETIFDLDTYLLVGGFLGEVYAISTSPVGVVGRHIFYNQSSWDGNSSAIDPANDSLAIAPDKTPYIPGSGLAVYSNITSFSRGINGIMIDLSTGVNHAGISASDFIFKVGNDNTPASWVAAPAPLAISVIPGGGVGSSDRVEITWATGSIKNQWLEVQVLPTFNTELALPDVFFWGNKVADSGTGTPAGTFSTTSTDAAQVFATIGVGKQITDLRDYNRDGAVTSTDAAIVNASIGNIVRLNIGGGGPFAPEAAPTAAADDGSSSAVAAALTSTPVNSQEKPAGRSVPQTVAHRLPANALHDQRIDEYFRQTIVGDTPRVHQGKAPLNPSEEACVFVDELLDQLVAAVK
jgi:hypothetical protein